MSNREIIRTRVLTKGPSLKYFQTFTLFAKILRTGEYGMQVSKIGTKSRFWIDIARYQADNNDSLYDNFEVGDEVELTVSFNTYLNRSNEHALKIHLVDIIEADIEDTKQFETKEQEFFINGQLIDFTKTEIPNLFILKLARLDELGQQHETYNIRYYLRDETPTLGLYEVVFCLKNTSKILASNGELYMHDEVYEIEVDGRTEERTNKVFVPYLEIRAIYPLPESFIK